MELDQRKHSGGAVVKAAIWFAVILFVIGVILMIWGVTKVKRAV
jgi:hypothetical protein